MEPPTSPRNILVTGATGKQGRAFIDAVLSSDEESAEDIRIIALTRVAESPGAKSLAKLSERIQVVQGDLDKPDTVRRVFEDGSAQHGGIWGVFVVLAFPGLGKDPTGEEMQGKVRLECSPLRDINASH